jgi:hypothetical protein
MVSEEIETNTDKVLGLLWPCCTQGLSLA